MRKQVKKAMLERWYQLVLKECDGTITPKESAKLDRYQALRSKIIGAETPMDARYEWKLRKLKKQLGAAVHHAGTS